MKDLAPFPLLLNMVEHGATRIISESEAQAMGFRIMIFLFACFAPAYRAIRETLEVLKREGVTGTGDDLMAERLFDVCGMQESIEIDVLAGSQSFEQVV